MSVTTIGRALLKACKDGSVTKANTLVPRLLAKGISKETAPPLKVAMATAAYHGHSDVLRNLMSNFPKGAEPSLQAWELPFTFAKQAQDLPSEWEASVVPDLVVIRAATGGSPRVMQTLMDFGLGVNYIVDKVGTPLCIALTAGKLDMVRFLLDKGADPNDQLWWTFVPFLMKAASFPEPDIMMALLEHGAELKGSRALQGAAEAGRIRNAEILLERGAEIDEVFRMGVLDDERDVVGTALHLAVKHGQEEFVRFLLARGARQDLCDDDGRTPMEVAVAEGNEKMIQLLKVGKNQAEQGAIPKLD